MDVSILLARIIGPLYLAVGIGLLANQSHYRDMLRNLPSGGMLYYVSGAIAFLFGITILQFHNLWVADWRVIFTLIGWLGLIKGIWLLVFPQSGARFSAQFAKSALLLGSAVFTILLGAGLSVMGYLT